MTQYTFDPSKPIITIDTGNGHLKIYSVGDGIKVKGYKQPRQIANVANVRVNQENRANIKVTQDDNGAIILRV